MRSVVKRFGEATVLDGLDLTVAAGERVALIGPSGSGKSTVLRILMTLETIDAGEIEVDGIPMWWRDGDRSPADRSPAVTSDEQLRLCRKHVGMVFQHFHLFPHMTVLRNLTEAPVRVLGLSRDEARQRARRLLERVGLADREASHPAQLSGGQKQRVAIARALAMEPDIMLFDEVTSALDPELVGEVLEVLRQLAQESRMTMLLVTHQMGFAREFADRIVFLDGGRIVEEGPPAQLIDDPRQRRTREFLRNLLQS